jgi:hypothetical protein
MTLSLYELIQRIVRQELDALRTAELAVVQEQHPHEGESDLENYACTVALRDSGIVLRQVPVATPRIGSVAIPAVGDMVLVQFLGGDVNRPVIAGSLYNDEDRPPPSGDGLAVHHLPLGAGDADAVHVELRSGDRREIVVRLGTGLSLSLRDDDPALELDVGGGKAKLSVDGDGAIKLQSQGKLSITASEITVEAQGQLTLKGATINLN